MNAILCINKKIGKEKSTGKKEATSILSEIAMDVAQVFQQC